MREAKISLSLLGVPGQQRIGNCDETSKQTGSTCRSLHIGLPGQGGWEAKVERLSPLRTYMVDRLVDE